MSIQRLLRLTLLLGLAAFCATGCLMRRTVKEDGAVVAQGYVVKPVP